MDKEVELERAKMRNYILEKENEILLGNIGALTNEKRELLKEIEDLKNSKMYRIGSKVNRIIRRSKWKKYWA